jgi:RNA polymerase sigma-70 factor (ECF subfamily)
MCYGDNCEISDTTLVELAKLGDKTAFGELLKRHHGRCVRLASFILRNRGDAEDETQNAYWKAFKHLDQFQGECEFWIWLSKIVTNQCLMFLRRHRRTRLLHLDAERPNYRSGTFDLPCLKPDPERETNRHQVHEVLAIEIRRIPPLLRNVVILRDIKELPMTAVATTLGITVSAAKSRLLRARAELRTRVLQRCGGYAHAMVRLRLPGPKMLKSNGAA